MDDRPLLTVILPTFNERDNIGPLITRIGGVLSQVPHEILVMDDRSPDGTAQAARAVSAGNPRVHVIERDPPAGLTRSIADGVERARGELVAWLDCDFSHPPELLPALVAPVRAGDADIACASRYVAGGSDERDSRAARWASVVITRLARALVDRRVTDYTTGYLVARRTLVRALGLRGDYGEYCIALLGDALRAGCRVREVPYRSVPRTHGESKTATSLSGFVRRGWRYLWTIAGLTLVRSRRSVDAARTPGHDVPRTD
ncbi:MAG TPA: polyprenol monophosphomannose synthase [Vicinamibacterales bacterium]|nr:polyprenol monophosphomannose synthase [Vicinamibacterales bacterium]